jgi:PAS domain S-box-containing protein
MVRSKSKMGRDATGVDAAAKRAERLASLVTLSYEPMLAWRLDGAIEFWNAGAERLYGFASDEAIGRSSHSLLQTKFPTEFAEMRSQLRNDGYWSGELRHVRKDGREVIVDSRQQLLADGTVLEVNRDVTERKQIQRALHENEERLRWVASIVDFSDDAIISKSLDGVITSWNTGAERVFGYTAEEAIGQPITIVIPRDRHAEERTILTRIRRGERIDHFETVRQRKNGSLIVISLTVSPVKNANGEVVGASKIARDVSEQKRAQEQIATLAREAEHRSKNLLGNVLATVKLSQSDTPEGLKQAIEGRIRALANVHSLFVQTRWIGAEMSAIARQELAPYFEEGETRARIKGPQILLEPNVAQSVAVILHELATNAAKYGSLSLASGRIDLCWSHEPDGRLQVRWTETGGPPVQTPTRDGFGGRIIKQMAEQLKGAARFKWHAKGLDCEINLQT